MRVLLIEEEHCLRVVGGVFVLIQESFKILLIFEIDLLVKPFVLGHMQLINDAYND